MSKSGREAGRIDGDDADVIVRIVEAVAEATGQPPTEIEPIGDRLDPDALESLIDSTERSPPDLHVSFRYEGQVVTIDGNGRVDVEPADW